MRFGVFLSVVNWCDAKARAYLCETHRSGIIVARAREAPSSDRPRSVGDGGWRPVRVDGYEQRGGEW